MRASKSLKILGFTLTELMVVVAIVAIITVLGVVSLNSRMKVSRLEEAAQALAADLSYTKTAALFKGCPTRIIFCLDKNCTESGRQVSSITVGTDGIGSGSTLARYFSILRKVQYTNSNGSCYSSAAGGDPDGGATAYFDNWDFDRKPQELPIGVAITPIYLDGVPDFSDWGSESSGEAGNSIWFPSSITDADTNLDFANIPVDNALAANGSHVVFQVRMDNCDPTDPGADCAGFLIVMDSSGETSIRPCNPGGRADLTDNCF